MPAFDVPGLVPSDEQHSCGALILPQSHPKLTVTLFVANYHIKMGCGEVQEAVGGEGYPGVENDFK